MKATNKSSKTLCVTILVCACGKEIKSSKEENDVVLKAQAQASTIELTVKTQNNGQGSQQVTTEASGWAKIPEPPMIIHSLSNLIYSTITFQTKATESSIQTMQLTCDYLSIKNHAFKQSRQSYEHQFIGCKEDIDGDGIKDDINYLPGDEIALEINQVIQLEVHSSDTTDQLSIRSEIEVDWR